MWMSNMFYLVGSKDTIDGTEIRLPKFIDKFATTFLVVCFDDFFLSTKTYDIVLLSRWMKYGLPKSQILFECVLYP